MQGLVISEETPIYLKINGVYADFSSAERFKISYPLYEGRNELLIQTRDASGQNAELSIEIIRNPESLATKGRNYVLIFAPNEYKYLDTDSTDTQSVLRLSTLWQTLETHYQGFDSSRYYTFFGKQAVKDRLFQVLKNISKELRPQDNLLLFLGGRSYTNWANGETYRLAYDAKKSNTEDFADAALMSQLLKINARNILVFCDGKMLPNYVPLRRQGLLAKANLFRARQILSAEHPVCNARNDAEDSFFELLNELLLSKSETRMSVSELFLRLNIKAQSFRPELRKIRYGEHEGGEFWFIAK
jgi:hypothetical protein